MKETLFHCMRRVAQLSVPVSQNFCTTSLKFTEATIKTEVIMPMELSEIVRKLNSFAPSTLAGSWDNVGILVEPSPPHTVSKVLLTNDLTEDVMSEALAVNVDMILSYHPPIFSPLKRLTQRTWKERILIKCLENRIAVYSPHTSFDAVKGGVNDWLLQPFAGSCEVLETVNSPGYPTNGGYRMELSLSDSELELEGKLLATPGISLMNKNQFTSGESILTRLVLNCTQKALPKAVTLAEEVSPTVEVMPLTKPPIPNCGPGRLMKLTKPISLSDATATIKQHLGLDTVRLATAVGIDKDKPLKKLAVCAGSGGSVLRGIDANLYLTGEMSHHEVLDATHRGIHVILCEHSNTERGYLLQFRQTLTDICDGRVEVHVSETDADPLKTV